MKVSVPAAVAASTACLWVVVVLIGLVVYNVAVGGVPTDLSTLSARSLLPYVLIGLAAQFVVGAHGMGYGVIGSALLIGTGLPPALSSMSVHAVETFTTAASGISHIRQRNVDWSLFARLVLPGIVGGLAGAVVILHAPVGVARPAVLGYLAVVGVILLFRAATGMLRAARPRFVGALGFVGGFFDASGGGGWGPIVTGNMMLQGVDPRAAIGTINLAEFFVTAIVTIFFIAQLGIPTISAATLGLLIGGLIVSPIAARLPRSLPPRLMMFAVGALLVAVALWGLL